MYKLLFLFLLLFFPFLPPGNVHPPMVRKTAARAAEAAPSSNRSAGTGWTIPVVRPKDPNELDGPLGYQTGKWVSINDRMQYIVRFENDPKMATAPAQNVYVHIPVPPRINGNTLKIGSFGFGSYTFAVPPNSTTYAARLDVRDSLGLYVDVTAGVDVTKNEVFWTFKSIDPLTGLPPQNAMSGFLPVNDTGKNPLTDTIPGKGEGYVSFLLSPKRTLLTGDTVSAQASIVFDVNDPIPTNEWTNTIDAFPPVSHVTGGIVAHDTITLHWSGQDDPGGTGIAAYTVYASDNNAPFAIYRQQVPDTVAVYVGITGHQYRFFSLATDNVGNKEALKASGDITVALTSGTPLPVTWLYFQGHQQGGDAILDWATTSEKDCRNYVVERSVDGKVFSEIGIEAALNTGQTNNYHYTDPGITRLNVSRVFYRLRQIMLDNRFSYSKTVVLPVSAGVAGAEVKAYPNPFTGNFTLEILRVTASDKTDRVSLYSLDGRIRYERSLSVNGSATILIDDLPLLEPGVYLLKTVINQQLFTIKMIHE